MSKKWIWAALGLAVTGFGGFFLRNAGPVGEVLELAAQGGDRVLRDPMRPLRGGTRVVIFGLDGVGDDEFRRAVQEGDAPNIATLFGLEAGRDGYAHGYAMPDALSILPSTTMAAWSSVFSGHPPARSGVPGNEWFVREERRFLAPAPVSVSGHEHTLEMLTDGLVGNAIRVPTLYDLAGVRSHVSLAPVYRGADLFTTPDPGAVADLFAEVAKGVVGEQSVEREAYSEIDLTSVDNILESFRERGVPDLQVVYFPGIDLFTHVASQPLIQEARYLRTVLDSAIGRVLRAYDSLGVLDDTYFVFVSDHGHTPVMSDDRHSLGIEGDDEPPAILTRTGFRTRPFVLELAEDQQDYQATVAYQGAMAYVYLADRSLCPARGDRCDWSRPPRMEEDVLPVVRAFHRTNEEGDPIPGLKGTLDLIFTREPKAPGEDALPFKVFDGRRLLPVAQYLARHPRPDLLRLAERLEGLAAGPYGHRAGDVLLLARSGLGRPIEERFYFSGPYQSWHGSPEAQDSKILIAVARTGSTAAELERLMRRVLGDRPSQLGVVELVRALLAQPAAAAAAGASSENTAAPAKAGAVGEAAGSAP